MQIDRICFIEKNQSIIEYQTTTTSTINSSCMLWLPRNKRKENTRALKNHRVIDSNMYSSILNWYSSLSSSATTTTTTTTTTSPSMVKIISQETIKPSSPTPHHLRTYKLSFLDHIAPPIYIPVIFYYETDGRHNHDHHRLLKKSLSETLTGYYPLAGKMKRNHEGFLYVDCTDDGVDYLEARVSARLHETIKNPDCNLLNQFLPLNLYQHIVRLPGSESAPETEPLLAVQVNTFDCGGLAVGISMSHELADSTTLISFIQTWAAKAHGGSGSTLVDPPLIGYESLFPPRALPDFPIGFFKEDIVTKRIVFDASKISALREKVIPMNDGSKLTRVEAVSAFIWRCFMNIHQAKVRSGSYYTESLKFLCVGHAVNVRKRIGLPPNSFGNLFFPYLMPMFSIDDESTENVYDCFVSRYKDMIRKVDEDYMRRELQKPGEDSEYLELAGKVGEGLYGGELETLIFSSSCRMGYYEVDFGWGKPIWISPGVVPVKDIVVLTDTKSGDGIEVWANMIPEDIDALECDEEFLAFFS